jgi:hypothetical protein
MQRVGDLEARERQGQARRGGKKRTQTPSSAMADRDKRGEQVKDTFDTSRRIPTTKASPCTSCYLEVQFLPFLGFQS